MIKMLIDCFLFVNEFEVLEIRLHEMSPMVDKFVIVEAEETFSGIEKPLQFKKNKAKFEQFMSKIIYIVPPKTSSRINSWDRQMYQRDYAMKAITCADNDLILIGDVDEIVSRKILKIIANDSNHCADKRMQTFIQKNFVYFLNRVRPGGWPGSVLISYRLMKELFDGSLYKTRMGRRSGRAIRKAGWHYSNLGGYANITRKLRASSHFNSEATHRMLKDAKYLKGLIMGKFPVKGRQLITVPLTTDWFPEWFLENAEKFDHLMFKGG